MNTQFSNTINENQTGYQNSALDSIANQANITNSQNLQSNCSTITPSPASMNNEIVSNYIMQFSILITNSNIQQNHDFLYIIPEKAPLPSCLSQINPRYKIRIEASDQDSTSGTAKYAIQNLALNEIYKIFYVRGNKEGFLEALHTTQRFKLILRTKTQLTPKIQTNNSKSIKNLFTQNDNVNLSNLNTSALSLEVIQVFEGDPDFYRENFDYEMKILMYTPQSKQKYTRLDTTPLTAPFQINYTNYPQETFTKTLNGNYQEIIKNIKNQSEGNSNFETCCNSMYQTNIHDNQIQQQQQQLKSYFQQNQSNFSHDLNQQTVVNNNNFQQIPNYHFSTPNNNSSIKSQNVESNYSININNNNNQSNPYTHTLANQNSPQAGTNNKSQMNDNKIPVNVHPLSNYINDDQNNSKHDNQIVTNHHHDNYMSNNQSYQMYNSQQISKYYSNEHNSGFMNSQLINNYQTVNQNKLNSSSNGQNFSSVLNSKCHSGQKINLQNAQIDETFIIDDSKFNDYAAHMNNLLKQKIESDNLCQDSQYNKQQNQENIPNNINCSSQLTLTKKQVMQKQKGKTISNYNSEEAIQKLIKANLNINKMIIQSAPKQNIEAKKGYISNPKVTQNNLNQLNKNQAFIHNSSCSNTSITPQSISKKTSNYQSTQNETIKQANAYQSNNKKLFQSSKESSQSQTNCNKFIMQTPCKNQAVSQTNTNYKPATPLGIKSVQNSGNIPRVKIDFQSINSNLQSQGSFSQFGKLLKSQKKHSFLSSKKTSLTNTPNGSEQKLHLRFENDINRMMIQQKVQSTQEMIMKKNLFSHQMNEDNCQKNEKNILCLQNSTVSPQNKGNGEGENTPVEQKLFTVEEANSPFETSINKFYTQKSSPSKYKLTQTEFNRIDECEEYNNTQYTNSDLKRIKFQLKQFRNDQESNTSSSQCLKTYEFYQNSAFNPDYNKIQQNKSNQNINNMTLSRREKTILYMIPVYEYKMEKLGFNFTYDHETKNVIIQKKETSSNQNLQQSVFKIDERIKTDQLTNYFEDICANIKYQTID